MAANSVRKICWLTTNAKVDLDQSGGGCKWAVQLCDIDVLQVLSPEWPIV